MAYFLPRPLAHAIRSNARATSYAASQDVEAEGVERRLLGEKAASQARCRGDPHGEGPRASRASGDGSTRTRQATSGARYCGLAGSRLGRIDCQRGHGDPPQ